MSETKLTLPEDVGRALHDADRLAVLHELHVLDTPPDIDFDRISRLAAAMFGAPFAQVSLVDADRQWYRACFGVEGLTQTSADISFCAHTIAVPDRSPLTITDMFGDERFRDNPFVTGWPGVRFYCGVPIMVRGQPIGTVCVLDDKVRDSVDPSLIQHLQDLAETTSSMLVLKDEARVRARTAAALMREEWRHALTLEAGKVGSWVWDIPAGEITCNDTFRRVLGLADGGAVRVEDVAAAVAPAERKALTSKIINSLKTGVDFEAEVRALASGTWLSMRGRVYQRDGAGRAMVMMGVCIDISDSKQNAEHTKLLLRELNHRVKNTLAMIQSVARQTLRQNPDPQQFLEAFSGRLRTISDAHLLLADRDWSGVQLHEVVAAELGRDFAVETPRLSAGGKDVALPPDHALGLGLILHELTTNAHRFGAWSGDEGRVDLAWEIEDSPVRGLRMHWVESGGPAVSEPKEPGLGVKLVKRGLAKVLDSNVELVFGADGVSAEIWLPLPPA